MHPWRADRGHRRIGPGVVQNDGRVEHLRLLVRIVIMDKHRRLMAQFVGAGFGAHRFGFENGLSWPWRNDLDQAVVLCIGGNTQRQSRGKHYCGYENAACQGLICPFLNRQSAKRRSPRAVSSVPDRAHSIDRHDEYQMT